MKEPKLRFKADDGSEFPEWETDNFLSLINEIIDFRGRTPRKLGMNWSETKTEHLALSAINVKMGYIDFSKDPHYGDDDLYKRWMSGRELYKGQVLFTTEAPIGNVAQVPDDNPYILSQRTIAFNVDKSRVSNDFLSHLLSSPKVQADLTRLATGGTAQGISQKALAKLPVRFPFSLIEQKKIADFLSAVDARITEQESYVADLQEQKKGFLQQIFSQKLHFKADDGSEFPEWNTTRFGDICDLITKGTTPSGYDKSGSVNFIRIDAIVNGKIQIKKCNRISKNVNDTELKRSVLHKNDILVGIVGSLGTVAIVTEDVLPANTSQQLAIIRLKNTSGLKFIKTILESTIFAGYIKKSAQTGAQPSLNLGQVNDFMFPLPSSDEQKKIADFFSALDEQIANEQAVLGDWKLLKKGLLQQMFI